MHRLLASFTIVDRYENNSGHIIRFVGVLKTPPQLDETWLKAVILRKAPLTWREVNTKHFETLNAIQTDVQLRQV